MISQLTGVLLECLWVLPLNQHAEPRNHCDNTDDRPDIVMFDFDNHNAVQLDICLAHPCRKDIFTQRSNQHCTDMEFTNNLITDNETKLSANTNNRYSNSSIAVKQQTYC